MENPHLYIPRIPKTLKEKREIYTNLAERYMKEETTIHKLCLESEQMRGWYPCERTLAKYIRNLKKQMYKPPFYNWCIIWNCE